MYFQRSVEPALQRLLKDSSSRDVIEVGGARQVGKSSAVLNVLKNFPNVLQVNLEEDLIFRSDIDQSVSFSEFEKLLLRHFGVKDLQNKILFIDEAQESDQLGSYVRFMKEKWAATKTVLSGSSMVRMYRPTQRIPVGRVVRLTVYPLNFFEFLAAIGESILLEEITSFDPKRGISELFHQKLLAALDLYLKVGGLPEVIKEFQAGGDFHLKRRNIFKFQEEDFSRKSKLQSRAAFEQGLKGIANNLGFPSKSTHLSENKHQANIMLEDLINWHIVLEVETKGNNATSNLYPKRYLYDIGVAAMLRAMPFPELKLSSFTSPVLRTQLGGILENLLLLNLQSQAFGALAIGAWKENARSSAEVDFVISADTMLPTMLPLECKSALKISRKNFSALLRYLEIAKLSTGFLVSAAPFQRFQVQGKTIFNLPLYLACKEVLDRLRNKSF